MKITKTSLKPGSRNASFPHLLVLIALVSQSITLKLGTKHSILGGLLLKNNLIYKSIIEQMSGSWSFRA